MFLTPSYLILVRSVASYALGTAKLDGVNKHVGDRKDEDRIVSTLAATLSAMGGREAIEGIRTFTYHTETIFRSHSLRQNYNLFTTEQTVSNAGTQDMTFGITPDTLKSRTDRSYIYDAYWIWASPDLQPPINYTLVVQDGPDGFACFTDGQNSFFAENPSVPLGYADPYLTDYLIHQSHQFALPWLLLKFSSEISRLELLEVEEPMTRNEYLSIRHNEFYLELLINTTSHLPPYNSENVPEDFIVTSISVNTEFLSDHFDPNIARNNATGQSRPSTKPAKPARSAEYPQSEVHEFFEAGLWSEPFSEYYNASDVVVEHPIQGLEEIMTLYIGYADYVQVVIEFDHGLLITDAPPHRSKIVLDWVASNMHGKQITHVVPSHHHRDHAGGVNDYVAAGATLVVPEVAKDLYNLTGRVSNLQTYNDEAPFVLRDSRVQFRSFWKDENPHAKDWSFGVATKANPADETDFVVFNADVVNPGTDATRWDTSDARRFFANAVEVGVPQGALLVGAHGSSHGGQSTAELLSRLAQTAAFDYSSLPADDWKAQHL